MGLRKKLNDFVREKGNKLGKKYLGGAHIGDYLTEEVSPRNAAMIGLSVIAPYMVGCSTAPKNQTINNRTNYIQDECIHGIKRSKRIARTDLRKNYVDTDEALVSHYDDKINKIKTGDDPTIKEIKEIEKENRRAPSELSRINNEIDTEVDKLYSKDRRRGLEMQDIFSDIDERYTDPVFQKESKLTKQYFGIEPFMGLMFQDKNRNKHENMDKAYPITFGLKFSYDMGDIAPYFSWETGEKNEIKHDDSNISSNIDSLLETYKFGVDWNVFNGEVFDVDLGLYLARTGEEIDGTAILNNKTFDIDDKQWFTGLGAETNLKWGNDRCSFVLGLGYTDYGLLNDKDNQNSQGMWVARGGISGKF